MDGLLQFATMKSRGNCCTVRDDGGTPAGHNPCMGRDIDPIDQAAGTKLQAWREFRGLTQTELAVKVDTTPGVISLLESGSRKLSPKWLSRLAPALGTTPGWLLEYSPRDLDVDILREWGEIPSDKRGQALAILRTFKAAS